MPHEMEKQFIKASVDLFNAEKRDQVEEFNERLIELSRIIDKSAYLRENISPLDVRDAISLLSWQRTLIYVSDKEFVDHIKSTVLVTKTYHFYYPIYNLREPSNNVKLGYSTILTFDALPKEIKEKFLLSWKNYFTIYTEWAKTEEEIVNRKKTATFLHLKVKANGSRKAAEKASNFVKDSVSILSFLYWVYFPINHCFYIIEGSKDSGGYGDYFYIPSLYIGKYQPKFHKRISELTDIIIEPKPTTIERKIKNSLRIFGIQKSITNEQVRFVLLVTCLESLLLTESDRGCMGWRLAEKTAFLAKNRKIVNDGIKLAYKKRSAFIHAKTKEKKCYLITEDDIHTMEGTVISVLRKLLEFKKLGYKEIEKKVDVKSIDGYVEEMKFRENNNRKALTRLKSEYEKKEEG